MKKSKPTYRSIFGTIKKSKISVVEWITKHAFHTKSVFIEGGCVFIFCKVCNETFIEKREAWNKLLGVLNEKEKSKDV